MGPGECVIYSGNTAKELVDGNDPFFGERRLWLCQYTSGTPTWNESWEVYWLWQYTDGQNGVGPHSIDGVGHCDINSYDQDGGAEQLIAEWASGKKQPAPPPPPPPPPQPTQETVHVIVAAPKDVIVKIHQTVLGVKRPPKPNRKREAGVE